jgi:hypothetical protein
MGVMKIKAGPRYKKTGSPIQKRQQKIREIASVVFAEMLPHVTHLTKRKVKKSVGLSYSKP